jgi:PAS domain S-box-containing protein
VSASVPQSRREELEAEVASLRVRLAEAEETIEAIQTGQVDALVIHGAEGQRIFSLTGAERPYRALIEQMGEGAAILDRDGSIQYCNRAFADLLSSSLETVIGQMFVDRVLNADQPTFMALLRQAHRLGAHGEIQLALPAGGAVPVFLSLTPLKESDSDSIALVAMDLTERKQAERVSWSAQFVRGLIEKAPIGIAVVDRKLRYTLSNPVFRTLVGEQIPSGAVPDLSAAPAPGIVQIIAPLASQVLGEGRAISVPECPVPGSMQSWWKLDLVPLFDEGEGSASVLILTEDITERRRAEETIRRSEELLREADRRKDEFLATLAHELRNPLAPIRTAARLLGSAKLGPQQLQWAQNLIQRQVGHMGLLLDDLLDVSRITQGKLVLKLEQVALTSIVDAAVEVARPLLDSKHHSFAVTLPPEVITVNADPLRLSQVISNLLTNAAKYTDPAGHIELTGSIQREMLCLSVKDDGIGIAPQSLERIFQMFSQVEAALGRSDGGLGIGLALVKGLVSLHGGTIEAHSAGQGLGSEFTVRLPILVAKPEAEVDHNRDVPVSDQGRSRVLLADDNKDAADALGMLLEFSGHEVRVVYNGRSALSLAQTFRPDLAILDIGMPEMNGYELARSLRRMPWGRSITLIALTGWGQDDDRLRATQAGFDHHLTKPVDPETVERLLVSARPSLGR